MPHVRQLFSAAWQRNPLARLWRSISYLRRGVRLHPSVWMNGRGILLGRGSSVGARARFLLGNTASVRIGEKVWISSDFEMETDGRIIIGAGTTIQRRCTINGNVTMGEQCILAPNVFISSGTHPFRAAPELSIREQERRIASGELSYPIDKPIVIEDDCWFGTNAVVCPGVTIGRGSVVGANSVVTRDIPAFSVVAGCPARKIGSRFPEDSRAGVSV